MRYYCRWIKRMEIRKADGGAVLEAHHIYGNLITKPNML